MWLLKMTHSFSFSFSFSLSLFLLFLFPLIDGPNYTTLSLHVKRSTESSPGARRWRLWGLWPCAMLTHFIDRDCGNTLRTCRRRKRKRRKDNRGQVSWSSWWREKKRSWLDWLRGTSDTLCDLGKWERGERGRGVRGTLLWFFIVFRVLVLAGSFFSLERPVKEKWPVNLDVFTRLV